MQSHSKQIGTLAGDHNKPAGPANMKGHMTQTKTEERNIKVTNPYSGQSEMLTQSEAIHYHMVKKFEELGQYELMQEGLSKFAKMNPKAYMTLLD